MAKLTTLSFVERLSKMQRLIEECPATELMLMLTRVGLNTLLKDIEAYIQFIETPPEDEEDSEQLKYERAKEVVDKLEGSISLTSFVKMHKCPEMPEHDYCTEPEDYISDVTYALKKWLKAANDFNSTFRSITISSI